MLGEEKYKVWIWVWFDEEREVGGRAGGPVWCWGWGGQSPWCEEARRAGMGAGHPPDLLSAAGVWKEGITLHQSAIKKWNRFRLFLTFKFSKAKNKPFFQTRDFYRIRIGHLHRHRISPIRTKNKENEKWWRDDR